MGAGKVGLPDAVNTITWRKISDKQAIVSNEKYKIEEVIRYHIILDIIIKIKISKLNIRRNYKF